jgi:acyl-coenzyme A thioesterase PaaI-like protein
MVHPAVDGREEELGDLADAVRRLIGLTVTSAAPPAELAAVAAELQRLGDRLAAAVPDHPPTHSMAGGVGEPGLPAMARRMPFDVVVGRYSPLALPVVMSSEGRTAVGRGRFTLPYEGPPGCVHGAIIASTFDIVCTAANVLADAAGPTALLSLRYRRPTLLHDEVTFEAWVERTEGRRTHTRGRAVQNGVVTAEAEGVFIALDREMTRSLGERARSQASGSASPSA